MNCIFCGSNKIYYEEARYSNMTMYQCAQCAQKWISPGRPKFITDYEKDMENMFKIRLIYFFHGALIWSVASIVY